MPGSTSRVSNTSRNPHHVACPARMRTGNPIKGSHSTDRAGRNHNSARVNHVAFHHSFLTKISWIPNRIMVEICRVVQSRLPSLRGTGGRLRSPEPFHEVGYFLGRLNVCPDYSVESCPLFLHHLEGRRNRRKPPYSGSDIFQVPAVYADAHVVQHIKTRASIKIEGYDRPGSCYGIQGCS